MDQHYFLSRIELSRLEFTVW